MTKKLPRDPNQRAIAVMEDAFKTEDGKNAAAAALGRLGGLKGGKARAANMTPEELSEAGRKAVQARWNKKPTKRK